MRELRMALHRRHQAEDPEGYRRYMRAAKLRSNYGITPKQYADMLEAQGGVCAICGSPDPGGKPHFAVDHDHSCCPGSRSCGRCVRGLLCAKCNNGIGMFADSPDRLRGAIAYLEEYA
jgi:hypothetical protein